MRCPICGVSFTPALAEKRPLPFCSERCRQIDLGRWMSESYAISVETDDEENPDRPSAFPEES